jgi:polyisoprenoid-binding protein YceI
MLVLLAAGAAHAQKQWTLVREKSTLQVELGKSGWLRVLGDEHLIAVGEYDCQAQFDPATPAGSSVELTIQARGMKVMDPHLSAEKRGEVQKKMEGQEVLDLARFPAIRFVSKQITAQGANRWRVEGDLEIRETPRMTAFTVTLLPEAGGYRVRGEAGVKMTAYGIEPPSAGGGSVKVKDEMKIVFDLLLVAVNN